MPSQVSGPVVIIWLTKNVTDRVSRKRYDGHIGAHLPSCRTSIMTARHLPGTVYPISSSLTRLRMNGMRTVDD
jgi:hypothetical protein